jgi:NAD(P)-dependent dehydrogenase (short-subunit alcohol dehydrogenase family)
MQGRKLLVAGASSGVGRAFAVRAAQAGAQVVASARRIERLQDMRGGLEGRLHAVAADIRRDEDCARLVETAAGLLGGLDAIVVAAGMSHLARLAEADGAVWREILETNVVGPALLCRHALAHLTVSRGVAVFVSSVSAEDPRPFLVPYGASKAALDATIKGWRNEHPTMRFVRIQLGPTATEFGAGWSAEEVAKFQVSQAQRGLAPAARLTVEAVADEILHIIRSPVRLDDVRMMPVAVDALR